MAVADGFPPEVFQSQEPVLVPTLRQDLELLESWSNLSGEPTWTIFDPLRNQYFRIGRTFFVFLSLWKLSNIKDIQEGAALRLKRDVEEEEIGNFVKFLLANQLTNVSSQNGYRGFFERAQVGEKGVFATALHGYLFFKIPLFKPQKFLNWTWPLAQMLFWRTSVFFIAVAGVLGLYLVSRQWVTFQDNFFALLSWEGAAFYGVSLVLVKICHELGHAYMAHRYGLKVSVIGVAFLVLMPIMYTDTSNAWRLSSKRKRLMVDGAGIMVELGLACLATFLWVFVPDGTMRSVLFSIAAVSWTLSLLINLNPFMRFDGYFILSDILEVENLQARGFALARWRMRELLFGLKQPPPENISPSVRRTLILHAWGTWLYRFFLFVGIALLVYTFFIKVMAIFLFVVEILWFICLPVFRELKEWWKMRDQIMASRRSLFTFFLLAGLVAVLFVPLSNTVSVIGVVHAAREVNVYAPYPAKLVQLNVENTQSVRRGDVLAVFVSEELDLKVQLLRKKITLLQQRIDRSGRDEIDGDNRLVLESELQGEKEALNNLLLQREQLVLKAGTDGVVADLPNTVHIGRYMDQSSPLFRLRSAKEFAVTGLVNEMHLARLAVGAKAKFYPDNIVLGALDLNLVKTNTSSTRSLSFPSMSSTFGGDVPSTPTSSQPPVLEVEGSYYGVEFEVKSEGIEDYDQTQRGILHVDAEPKSYAKRIFERVGTVLIRESGF